MLTVQNPIHASGTTGVTGLWPRGYLNSPERATPTIWGTTYHPYRRASRRDIMQDRWLNNYTDVQGASTEMNSVIVLFPREC